MTSSYATEYLKHSNRVPFSADVGLINALTLKLSIGESGLSDFFLSLFRTSWLVFCLSKKLAFIKKNW